MGVRRRRRSGQRSRVCRLLARCWRGGGRSVNGAPTSQHDQLACFSTATGMLATRRPCFDGHRQGSAGSLRLPTSRRYLGFKRGAPLLMDGDCRTEYRGCRVSSEVGSSEGEWGGGSAQGSRLYLGSHHRLHTCTYALHTYALIDMHEHLVVICPLCKQAFKQTALMSLGKPTASILPRPQASLVTSQIRHELISPSTYIPHHSASSSAACMQ